MWRCLFACSRFLAAHTSLFVMLVAALAFWQPSLFDWVRGDTQAALLGFIMLTMGLTLSPQDFRALSHRPFSIVLGTVAQYTIMPLLAWGLTSVFELPRGVAMGLILVGCCPGGVSSNIMSFLCRGDVAFSVGMTTASTLLAPVVTPLLVWWLSGASIEVDTIGMFSSILLVTIVPVVLGTLGNAFWGHRAVYRSVCLAMPGASVIGLACIVGGVISACGLHFRQSGVLIFVTVLLHNFLGYVLGYLMGRTCGMPRSRRRTLSIEVGMQNAGLATVLAGRHFPLLPEAAVASALCCVWHSISGTLLAGFFNALDRLRGLQPDENPPLVEKLTDTPSEQQ